MKYKKDKGNGQSKVTPTVNIYATVKTILGGKKKKKKKNKKQKQKKKNKN